MSLYNEGWFNDYVEPYDKMDDPIHETEFQRELEQYWEAMDDRARWSE